jgi:tetratricopeptide (TPR) repeat protein
MRQQKWSETVSVLVRCFAVVLVTAFAVTAMLGTSCNTPDEPETANDWYKKGKYYSDRDTYGKAIEYLTKAIELDPNHEKSYSLRGYCYYSMVQYEEAISDFEMALKLGNEKADESYYYMGWAHYDMENYEEAVKCFTIVVEMHPNSARFHYDRACAYNKLGLFIEAEKDLRKACSLGDSDGCEEAKSMYKDRIEREKEEKGKKTHQNKIFLFISLILSHKTVIMDT